MPQIRLFQGLRIAKILFIYNPWRCLLRTKKVMVTEYQLSDRFHECVESLSSESPQPTNITPGGCSVVSKSKCAFIRLNIEMRHALGIQGLTRGHQVKSFLFPSWFKMEKTQSLRLIKWPMRTHKLTYEKRKTWNVNAFVYITFPCLVLHSHLELMCKCKMFLPKAKLQMRWCL
jgi:hypothetical protein